MEKLVYVLRGEGGAAAGDDLRRALLDDLAPRLLGLNSVRGLGVDVHDTEAAEAPAPVPPPEGEPALLGLVGAWVDSHDRHGPAVTRSVRDVAGHLGVTSAGYLCLESLYDDHGTTRHDGPRTWPDGERSPGVLTVAVLHRPAGMAGDEWRAAWHGVQSPVSADLQPRVRYVRHEVVRPVTPDAPEVDGIVEEGWTSAAVVADPLRFFGAADEAELADRVGRMLTSVSGCLDLERFRTNTMSEYLLRTP